MLRPDLTCAHKGHDNAEQASRVLGMTLSWECPTCHRTFAWCFGCSLGGTAERELHEHREVCHA